METRTCAASDCVKRFEPVADWQLYCSKTCKSREGVRRCRSRKRLHLSPPPGGPGGGFHPTYDGAGLSASDGSLPVIGPKKRSGSVPAPQPQPQHTGAIQRPLFDLAEAV